MSIWNLPVGAYAPEPEITVTEEPLSLIEEADRKSFEPFNVQCIGSILTHRGVVNNFKRGGVRYKYVDHGACKDAAVRIRCRRAKKFEQLCDEYSARHVDTSPVSGVRAIIDKVAKRLKVGT